jgi:hypothetical protein
MKSKKYIKEIRRRARRAGQIHPLRVGALFTACLAAISASGAETNSPPVKAEPALTPQEFFEGGKETYNNWIELGAGGFFVDGSKSQAQQRQRNNSVFGGIEDFHYVQALTNKTTLTLDGRALFDQNDYKVRLELARENLGYLRLNYTEFRTWYNGNGGYYPPSQAWYPLSDDALTLDRGEFSFEGGLLLPKKPKLTFGYTHKFREGEKSSTIWGTTHPNSDALTRGLSPSFYDIDEYSDIFEFDVAHRIKKTDFGLGVRYETGKLDDKLKITQNPSEPLQQKITDHQGTSYNLFNVHAFSETWIKKNLFFSSGASFSDLDNDFSGSRIYGSDFDVGYVPSAASGSGYYGLNGGSHLQEYVMNLNLMAIPAKNLVVVPSLRVQYEDINADSSGMQTSGVNAPVPFSANSDRNVLDVTERLDLRYTGVTNWVFTTRGEWTQGQGNLNENGGLGQINGIGIPSINRETDDNRFFQKYSLGATWYPTRRVSVDAGGYYKINHYDYDHESDSTPNDGANRYPAYLVMQDFETYDGNARLTLRPHSKVTLVTRYEFQFSTVHTKPDAISLLPEEESSQMQSHIIAQNISWTPWSRLYFQVGFNYVLSTTRSPDAQFAKSILAAQNNYWTLNASSGIVLDDKTDLNLGYFYYRADDYQDNSTVGLPYGSGAEEQSITATLVRRINKHLRLNLKYGFSHYTDELYGNHNDYDAHFVSSSLQYRF